MIKLNKSGKLIEDQGIILIEKRKNGFDKATVRRSIFIKYQDGNEVTIKYSPDDEYHVPFGSPVPDWGKRDRNKDFEQLEAHLCSQSR